MIGVIALGNYLRKRVSNRLPDVCIGGDETPDGCYMARWFIIPRNNWLNIYLHRFQHDDDDRAPHDHPYPSMSMLFEGAYIEHCLRRHTDLADVVRIGWASRLVPHYRRAGQVHLRKPSAVHRITLLRDAQGQPCRCWSIFVTGTRARVWGFWCGKDMNRFVPHDQFIGNGGCGEV